MKKKKVEDGQYSISRLTINLHQPRQHSIKERMDTQSDGTDRGSRNKPAQIEFSFFLSVCCEIGLCLRISSLSEFRNMKSV